MTGRLCLVSLIVLGISGIASAQERIPTEEAQKIAKALTELAEKQTDLALKTEVDPEKPCGMRHEQFGALVIPTKGLLSETIAKADKDVVPIGQFWMRNLVPMAKDGPVPASSLRTISIDVNNEKIELTLYLLGVRKGSNGDLELVIYANGKEPLLTKPLEKGDTAQSYPIEIEGKEEDGAGLLTLFLTTKYRVSFKVAPNE